MLDSVLNEETEKIFNLYKTEKEKIKELLISEINKKPELLKIWQEETNSKNIYRTRNFKEISKKVRKTIYYDLRTYKTNSPETGVNVHISTKEREQYLDKFFSQIDELLKNVEYILDVGGGIFPLSFPFNKYPNIKKFVWVDKDKRSYDILQNKMVDLPTNILELYNDSIGEKKWNEYLPDGKSKFDLAIMLKLIPVVFRQERGLLNTLKEIPASYYIVTGNKESMVKKVNIENKELQILKKFINAANRQVYKKIDIENEFGYILK